MVSRENTIILACSAIALVLAYASTLVDSVSSTVSVGILLLVGVITPIVLNSYFDSAETE